MATLVAKNENEAMVAPSGVCVWRESGVPAFYGKPDVLYRVHKSLPLGPIPSQLNRVHILTHYFGSIFSVYWYEENVVGLQVTEFLKIICL
jgi:hypothetical protein